MKDTGTVTEFNDIFDATQKVYWHRLWALISTIFGLLVALFAMSARAKDPDEGATWKLGAIILAAGIGYVGMTGGKLQYPSNHYKDLNSLWTEMVGDIGGEDEPEAENADDGEPSDDPDMESTEEDESNDETPSVSGQMSNTI